MTRIVLTIARGAPGRINLVTLFNRSTRGISFRAAKLLYRGTNNVGDTPPKRGQIDGANLAAVSNTSLNQPQYLDSKTSTSISNFDSCLHRYDVRSF